MDSRWDAKLRLQCGAVLGTCGDDGRLDTPDHDVNGSFFCSLELVLRHRYRYLASIAKLRLEERPCSSKMRRALGEFRPTKKKIRS